MTRKIIFTLLIIILSSSIGSMSYNGYSGNNFIVHELPFDMIISDVPGKNYVVFSVNGSIIPEIRFLKMFKRSDLPVKEVEYRGDLLFSLIYNRLMPVIKARNLSDYIDIMNYGGFDPPVLLIGIYDPTPDKVNFIISLLESQKKVEYTYDGAHRSFNYTYILYRMLTPLSWNERIREIVTNKTIDKKLEEIASNIFHENIDLYYLVGGGDGLTIIIRKPDPDPDEIKNWFISIRRIISKDIPIITAFVDRDYPHIIPEEKYVSSIPQDTRLGDKGTNQSKPYNWLLLTVTIIIPILILIIWKLIKRKSSL